MGEVPDPSPAHHVAYRRPQGERSLSPPVDRDEGPACYDFEEYEFDRSVLHMLDEISPAALTFGLKPTCFRQRNDREVKVCEHGAEHVVLCPCDPPLHRLRTAGRSVCGMAQAGEAQGSLSGASALCFSLFFVLKTAGLAVR